MHEIWNPLSFGDTLSPSPGGCSLWQSCARSESPTVSGIKALGPLWVPLNTGLQRKVRRVCGQGTFTHSNCWFVAQKCRCNSLGFIFDGPSTALQVQDVKFFHLASNAKKAQEEKHLFRILHLMCICFGSPSVTWLRLGKHVAPLTFPNIDRGVLWPTVWPAVRLSLGSRLLSDGPGDGAKIVTHNMSKKYQKKTWRES